MHLHIHHTYELDRLIRTLNTQPYLYVPSECASQYSGIIMCNPDTLGTEDTALIIEVSDFSGCNINKHVIWDSKVNLHNRLVLIK